MRLHALLFLAGCAAADRAVQQPAVAASSSVAIAPPAASSSAVTSVPAPSGAPNPKLFADVEDDKGYLGGENRYYGFSKDDAYLGYSISGCDPCPLSFHFESPTKKALDFSYYSDQASWDAAKEKVQNAAVDRKLEDLGVDKATAPHVLRGPFPYPDLVFARFVDRAPAIGKSTLLFGARVGGYAPVYPIEIEVGPHPMFDRLPAGLAKLSAADRAKETKDWHEQWMIGDPFVAYSNVTHDGSEIGVVAVATGAMWWETAEIVRMPTAQFVGHVYNGTGMRLHQSAHYKEAVPLFEKAEAANPKESLFPYNLACALARSGEVAKAKEALARAIQKGGASVKERATKDPDLAGIQ